MNRPCKCEAIGQGVQTFRVRWLTRCLLFRDIARLDGVFEQCVGYRQVCQCRRRGHLFAVMLIPFKDEEEIMVRGESSDWEAWDWSALADVAVGAVGVGLLWTSDALRGQIAPSERAVQRKHGHEGSYGGGADPARWMSWSMPVTP